MKLTKKLTHYRKSQGSYGTAQFKLDTCTRACVAVVARRFCQGTRELHASAQQIDPRDESYAREVHSREGYPARELSHVTCASRVMHACSLSLLVILAIFSIII